MIRALRSDGELEDAQNAELLLGLRESLKQAQSQLVSAEAELNRLDQKSKAFDDQAEDFRAQGQQRVEAADRIVTALIMR